MSAIEDLQRILSDLDSVADRLAQDSHQKDSTDRLLEDLARRGITIQGVSAFENFIRERRKEWVASLTAARVGPARLPGGPAAIADHIVEQLPKYIESTDSSRRSVVASDIGRTFDSLTRGAFVAHEVMFAWPGSNIRMVDIDAMIQQLGVPAGINAVTPIWSALTPSRPKSSPVSTLIESFTRPRHVAAHNVHSIPDAVEVGGVTKNVRLAALLLDSCISLAIHQIRTGKSEGGSKLRDIASGVRIRQIKRTSGGWSEYPPGSGKAYRTHSTLESALSEASGRSLSKNELLVALDDQEIVSWRSPI